jgi:hypothetical protein
MRSLERALTAIPPAGLAPLFIEGRLTEAATHRSVQTLSAMRLGRWRDSRGNGQEDAGSNRHCLQVVENRAVNLAEREGFEPSVQVLARTTV